MINRLFLFNKKRISRQIHEGFNEHKTYWGKKSQTKFKSNELSSYQCALELLYDQTTCTDYLIGRETSEIQKARKCEDAILNIAFIGFLVIKIVKILTSAKIFNLNEILV